MDEGIDKASTWLGGGIALLTVSLGAIGGLTGGIARMFRNSSGTQISVVLALVLGAVLLAVTSRLPENKRFLSILMLVVSTLLFGCGTYWALNLMVSASRIQDRPTLSAQLSNAESAGWILKVQASSSGLDADDQLLVLVYTQPKRVSAPRPTTSSSRPPQPSSSRSTTPASTPTRTAAPRLDGDQLLFAQAGANIEGVATQEIELPLTTAAAYTTIVVTAVVGEFPRDCEGATVNVRDNTELLVPPEVLDENGRPLRRNGTLSCLTLTAPRTATSP